VVPDVTAAIAFSGSTSSGCVNRSRAGRRMIVDRGDAAAICHPSTVSSRRSVRRA
jgi:hypothetical protein